MIACSACGTQNEDNAATCASCFAPLTRPAVSAPPPHHPPPIAPGAAPFPPVPPVPPAMRPPQTLSAGPIPNYLVQAILCTIFCCPPAGVVGIIFAAQVNTKLQAGDLAGAQESSSKAKLWCWVSFGLGIGVVVISFFFGVLGALRHGFER